jgi:ACT domain-containing protein
MKQKENPILTVLGRDKKGIVAQISTFLANQDINIEEIKQGVIEGNFFMVMSVDVSDAGKSFHEIADELKELGSRIGVEISFYNQEIFKAMHKV